MTSMVRPLEILLVEDNTADARLVRELLAEAKLMNVLRVAGDGEAALALLRGGNGSPAHHPDLILLDLNLPKRSGHEVLEEIKNDPDLHNIPIVVLTTSDQERDVVRSYDLRANAYVVKPVDPRTHGRNRQRGRGVLAGGGPAAGGSGGPARRHRRPAARYAGAMTSRPPM